MSGRGGRSPGMALRFVDEDSEAPSSEAGDDEKGEGGDQGSSGPRLGFRCGTLVGAAATLLLLLLAALGVRQAPLAAAPLSAWFSQPAEGRGARFRGDRATPEPFSLAGKSVYFLVLDRFARQGEDEDWPPCTGVTPRFCGGNLQGVIERLGYIQGMGFDCVWITPPVKQFASSGCHVEGGHEWCNDGYSGYWAADFFSIDPHFGTGADLRQLADELHARGMCLVLDVVTNHGGIVHSESELKGMNPFDKLEYYNQIAGPGSLGLVQAMNGTWRPPASFDCGPHNPDNVFCASWCGPGAFHCPLYDQQLVDRGWFGSLGDLNQSHPFVRQQLLDYVRGMVRNYSVDAIRLDTAAYMPRKFLSELQTAAGVDVVGEVTTMNMTHQASYTRYPPRTRYLAPSHRILKGTLNFPVFYYATGAFCGWITFLGWVGEPHMANLTTVLRTQETSDIYEDLGMLGNFLDNHDEEARIAYACRNDASRLKNALAWLLLYQGIPVVYYGTEQGFASRKDHGAWQGDSTIRESLWQTGYSTTSWQYAFLAKLNRLRGDYRIGGQVRLQTTFKHPNQLVFTRGEGYGKVGQAWVFVNNFPQENATQPVVYCPGPFNPKGLMGRHSIWTEVLSGDGPADLSRGCYHAPNAEPKVLVLLRA